MQETATERQTAEMAAAIPSAKFSIANLTNQNYQSWKFKMKMLLIREGTWKCINEPRPAQPTEEWLDRDQKAQSTISLCIDDDQIIHICNCQTAKDMWEELQKAHERVNLSNKLYLIRKLYQTKLQKDQDMQDYIRQTLEMVERLRGIGEEIKDFHVAALLLSGLPESYETLVTALDARPDDDLTLEYVKGKLVDEYKRKTESMSNVSVCSETALKTKYKNKHSNVQLEKRECFVCKKPGHLKADCRIWKARMQKQSALQQAKNVIETKEYAFGSKNGVTSVQAWCVDSGATSHMTNDRSFFAQLDESKTEGITTANGQFMKSVGIGDGFLYCPISPDITKKIHMRNVLYVPDLESNLLSVKKLTNQGNVVTFQGDSCVITKGDCLLAKAKIIDELYQLNCSEMVKIAKEDKHSNCIHTWHRRLGHRNSDTIKKIVENNYASGIKINPCDHIMICTSCIKGKMARTPFPKQTNSKAQKPLDLIHSDLCGPMKTMTPGKKKYFLTFIDDYSRYTTVFLLHNKDEVPEKLEEYLAQVNNIFGGMPRVLRTDNGSEYTSGKTQAILRKHGIMFQTTVPYNPEQNGVAERMNRTLCESGRSMLFDADMPTTYWGEAITTACYLQNRLPGKATTKTPYELWNKRKPDLRHIRIFGSKAYVHIPKEKRTKWDACAKEGVLVGYSESQKGYRILHQDTNKVTVSRSVIIDETSLCSKFEPQTQTIQTEKESTSVTQENKESDTEIEITAEESKPESEPEIPSVRKSTRINKGVPAERLSYIARRAVQTEPGSWKEMQKLPMHEKQVWNKAADEEMTSLEDLQTWTLSELPQGKHAIGCKWVFKTKCNSEGKVCRYKARLVAKGYSQKFGEDYDATFAPVAKQSTFRTLMTVAAMRTMIVKHHDIKTAFLNGDIEEEIYMSQPEGYLKKGQEHLVCKLNKSLYGLKQSARAWNLKINQVLLNEGFTRSKADPCLYA